MRILFESMYSKLFRELLRFFFAKWNTFSTLRKSCTANATVYHSLNLGTQAIAAHVVIPRVPSAPIYNYFMSYSVFSFRQEHRLFKMRPSGKAASKPKTVTLHGPSATNVEPPALFANLVRI